MLITEKKVSPSEKLKKMERILESLLKHPGWNKTNIKHLFCFLFWTVDAVVQPVHKKKKCVCISRNLCFSGRMERINHSDQNFWLELWRINVVKYRKILQAFQTLESKFERCSSRKRLLSLLFILEEGKVIFFLLFKVLVEVLYLVW